MAAGLRVRTASAVTHHSTNGRPALGRVALVSHWDWPLYNYRMPLAECLRDLGFEVLFISPKGRFTHEFERAGYRWIEWRMDRGSVDPLEEAAAILRLWRIYRRERPAVVNHFHIKPSVYGAIAAALAGVRPVVSVLPGLGFSFSRSRRAKRLRLLVKPLLRLALGRGSAVTIFLQEDDRDRLARWGLVPPDRAVVIPDAVDTTVFRPLPRPVATGRPVVLMASRLLWDKGVGEFIEASAKLRARGVPGDFRLAGEPDPGNPARVPNGVLARWKDEGPVEFLGLRLDMPALLREVDVVVLPTHHEGMGRVLLEAAACGLPLVASDLPGPRRVVRPGVNGFLVPPRDPAALANALERLLMDPTLRACMGQASRAIAVSEFEERDVLKRYVSLYEALGVLP